MTGRLRDAFPVCHASNRKRLTFFEIIFRGPPIFPQALNGNALCDAPRQILAAAQRHAWPAVTAHKRKRFFAAMALTT
ncbi:hypothetical protein, partial [Pseudomonas amygdali]|uniref:hypothetical protein n=1 Tax=Pseudomonas amygdali TaxID=47877 RepID=UPI001C7F645D